MPFFKTIQEEDEEYIEENGETSIDYNPSHINVGTSACSIEISESLTPSTTESITRLPFFANPLFSKMQIYSIKPSSDEVPTLKKRISFFPSI